MCHTHTRVTASAKRPQAPQPLSGKSLAAGLAAALPEALGSPEAAGAGAGAGASRRSSESPPRNFGFASQLSF